MKKSRVKKQHYIPRASYLEQFADKSKGGSFLWVYNISNATIDFAREKKIPPIQLCKETYMYETPDLPVNLLENVLGVVESQYGNLFEEKISKKLPLLADEKEIVSLFISTLEARVPEMRKQSQEFIDDIQKMANNFEDIHTNGKESKTNKELAKIKDSVFQHQLAIASHINRWRFSNFLFLFNDDFYNIDKGLFFITSNRPVTLYDFTGMNGIWGLAPMSEDLEVIVPLSSQIVLFINNRNLEGYREIDPNFIREVNNRVAIYSSRIIISPHRLTQGIIETYIKHHRQSFILKYMPRPEKTI